MNKKIELLKDKIRQIKESAGLSHSEKVIRKRIAAEEARIKTLEFSFYFDVLEMFLIRILNVILVLVLLINFVHPIFTGINGPIATLILLVAIRIKGFFNNKHMVSAAKKEYFKTKRALRSIKPDEIGGLSKEAQAWYLVRDMMVMEVDYILSKN